MVEKEAAVGGSMSDLPSWHVKASPWIAGALALAALVRGAMKRYSSRAHPTAQDEARDCCDYSCKGGRGGGDERCKTE